MLAMLVVNSTARAQSPEVSAPAAVGGDRLIWFIDDLDPRTDGFDLCVLDVNLTPPSFQILTGINERTERLAAWGERLWIVYPRMESSGRDIRREVYSIDAEPSGLPNIYQADPADHYRVEPPLPPLGRLADVVGTTRGLVALLLPAQRSSIAITSGPDSQAAAPALKDPVLLGLRGNEWVESALPEEIRAATWVHVAPTSKVGRLLFLLSGRDDEPGRAVGWWGEPGGPWRRQELDIGDLPVEDVLYASDQVVLVQHDRDRRTIRLSLCRPEGMIEVAQLDSAGAPWSIAWGGDALKLFTRQNDRSLSLQRIDPISGRMSTVDGLGRIDPRAQMMRRSFVTVLLLVLLVIAALVVRGPDGTPVHLAPTDTPLSPGRRLMALLLDFAPGAVASVALLKCSYVEVLRHPILGGDVADLAPFFLMLGITIAHVLASELFLGTTIGKALLRARVVGANGERPSDRQVLIRNALKLLILLLPPLVVLMFRSPNLQGLHDQRSHTVVVQKKPESASK